jgi:Holliday junction resolvase RusA-like endonuclease
MAILLEVPGQPVPQPRARITTRGGFAHGYTPSKHPIHAYREAIWLMARGHRIEGPLQLDVVAIFARPPSHWRKHDLSPKAPGWPKADGDNVIKGVADALKVAGVYHDDDQIVDWHIRKRFAARGEQARTIIRITEDAVP